MNDQEDIDQAAEHQQSLDERQQRENSGAMDPSLFTRPLNPWPRLTSKEQAAVDVSQLKAMRFALDKIFGGK